MTPYYHTIKDFSNLAKALRKQFDSHFANPLRAHAKRFVWDYWHIPEQYSFLRTPAFEYFTPPVYEAWHRQLVKFGRENLGCHDISPPWLSCYLSENFQAPHVDLPHGPIAFVFSLTRWQGRRFRGGETELFLRPRVKIPPRFNQLTLFDPSIPHGVAHLRGNSDPRYARLVMNGWFVQPRPFWTGGLRLGKVERFFADDLGELINGLSLGDGFLSLRAEISSSGDVRRVHSLVSTLKGANDADVSIFKRRLVEYSFGKISGPSRLTIPLMIES